MTAPDSRVKEGTVYISCSMRAAYELVIAEECERNSDSRGRRAWVFYSRATGMATAQNEVHANHRRQPIVVESVVSMTPLEYIQNYNIKK